MTTGGSAKRGGPKGRGGYGRGPARPGTRASGDGRASDGSVLIYGFHAVAEALANPRRHVRRLLATENAAARLRADWPDLAAAPEIVRPDVVGRLVDPDAVHQGIVLEADPLPVPDLSDLPADGLLLALDQITDPHNVGAILRSAAAFGVDAVVTTNRHAPAATGVLAKAASGGLEHVPIVAVRNLGDALLALGADGWQRIGLDSDGTVPLREVAVTGRTVLVLGAEGKGLRERTRGCCDTLARLPMPGAIRSLNVSNAAAVALYGLTEARLSTGR